MRTRADAPPRLAEWLIERCLPEDEREFVVGDLEQVFREDIAPRRCRRAARRWYWRQALVALFTLRGARSRTARPVRHGDGPMRNLIQDIRYGLRMLARAPGFTAIAVLTLALGIGANTAIFSVVNPILFAPLPYPDAGQLVMVSEGQAGDLAGTTGWATVHDIEQQAHTLQRVAAIRDWNPIVTGTTEPERLQGQRVSWSYFDVLGIRPALGRNFLPAEDAVGGAPTVILSYGLWRRRFGADRGIVGRPVELSGRSYIVAGVMPAGFENLLSPQAQLWAPLAYDATLPYACRDCRHLRAVARVKDGIAVSEADRELQAISRNLVRAFPTVYSAPGFAVVPLQVQLTRSVRPALLAILGAVGLVLLIACANVMSLLLARSAQRGTEFAIRVALGAGHRRVVRQLLTESVLLALLGAGAGLVVAELGLKALLALAPAGLPRLEAIRLDGRVLAFTLAVATFAGVVFGIAPALAATRSDLHGQLKQDARRGGGRPRITRGAMVVSEVALAVMLLIGAGLLLRSLGRLLDVKPGVDVEHLLTMNIQTGGPRYVDDAPVYAFYARVIDAVRILPGVTSADVVSQLPLGGNFDSYGVRSEEKPAPNPADDPSADRYAVSTGYLHTMGIPLLLGRDFTPADRDSAPAVILINETFAKRQWPGANPIGQRVKMGEPTRPWRTIVGIVGDVHHVSLEAPQSNQFYTPTTQWFFADNAMTLVVRTTGDPVALAPSVRAAVRSVDPDQPITKIASMDQIIAQSTAQRRFALLLFEAFALVALALAAAGIYGVLSGMVAERTREIGIRSALGASRGDLFGLVVRRGLGLTALGVTVGGAGALALSRVLDGLLFGVGPRDPATFAGVVALLAMVALIACMLPAWRAARVDPMVALRAE